ncbi:MAG: hypothetical protein IJT00_05565 [Lachnospiraceae bacterium]|nr:hypothetical protein [Lachnospiraceae bacterium]
MASKRHYGFATENLPGLLTAASAIFGESIKKRFLIITGGFVVMALGTRAAMNWPGAFPAGEVREAGTMIFFFLKAAYIVFSLYTAVCFIRLGDSGFLNREIINLPWVLCRFPGRFLILNIEEVTELYREHGIRELLRMNLESRKRVRMRFRGDRTQLSKDVRRWLRKNRFWPGTPVFETAVDQMITDMEKRGKGDGLFNEGFSFLRTVKVRQPSKDRYTEYI